MPHRLLLALSFAALAGIGAGCSSYDNTDYSGEVRQRAAAEFKCDEASIQLTGVGDNHGVHTWVATGCGCTATYICQWKDYDSCNREPTLEPAGSTCHS